MNCQVSYKPSPQALINFSRLTSYLKLCYRFIVMWLLMVSERGMESGRGMERGGAWKGAGFGKGRSL